MIYDFVVLGAGAAGLTAAYTAKGFNKKVLLIDKSKPGGDCTWFGCVPSKTLISISKKVWASRNLSKNINIDSSEVMKQVQSKVQKIYLNETPAKLRDSGIDFEFGEASFLDSNTVLVNNKKIKAKKIIICTGSKAKVPDIPGLNDVDYLTNKSFFQLPSLPKSITILGAGAIGVELSQALNRLGVKVNLVELQNNILPREELSCTKILEDILIKEGVNLLTGHKAVRIDSQNDEVVTTLEINNRTLEVRSESILIALGRNPNIETLQLDKAGIEYSKKGIVVNSYLQTNLKHIFAAGDICSPYQFSHMANIQAITAVKNAFLPIKTKIDYSNVAWCTFSEPELARSGLSESEARTKFANIQVYDYDFKDNDRAITEDTFHGTAKVITDSKGYILGASVLSEHAGDIINEVQVVKSNKIKLKKLANVIHPYPTYGEFLNKLGKKALVDSITKNYFVKLLRK